MINSSLNRKVALTNIAIASVLVADSFLIKLNLSREFFTESSHKFVPTRRTGGGRTNYYIHSTTGHRYKVPEEIYIELSSARDSFFIYKTGIFGKSLKIKYKLGSTNYLGNIGMLNSGKACQIFLLYAAAISLLNLFPFLIIPHENVNQVLLFLGFCLLAAVVIIYFWWNT